MPCRASSRPFWTRRSFLVSALTLSALGVTWAQDASDLPGADAEMPGSTVSIPPEERNQWRHIVIHHSASAEGNAATFNAFHRKKGWDELAYHFVITNGKGGPDGGLEVSPRWWRQKHGAHAGHLASADPEVRNAYNEFGIGICLVGNFEKKAPSRAQLQTLADLLGRLRREFDIREDRIVGHQHVKGTACPGRQFPWRTLYAMMDLQPPQHLRRQGAYATRERCPWCVQQSLSASGKTEKKASGAPVLPPPVMLFGQ